MKTLLKYLVCILLAVGLGLLSGWLYQRVESSTITEHFFSDQWKPKSDELNRAIALVIGEGSADVGTVAADAVVEKEFIIKNEGLQQLEIWLGETAGESVTSDLTDEKKTILPNGTYPVTVTVDLSKLKLKPGQRFEQKANIATSDDENATISFSVTGKVAE